MQQDTPQSEYIRVEGDWIYYPLILDSIGIPESDRKIERVQGVKTPQGCEMQNMTELESDDSFSEEIAFNPTACESIFAYVKLTPQQNETLSNWFGEVPSSNVLAMFATTTLYKRHAQHAWVDPIKIDIARQTLNISWGRGSSNLLTKQQLYYGFKLCFKKTCFDETYLISKKTGGSGLTMTGQLHMRNTSFAKYVTVALGTAGWVACGAKTSSTANFHFSGTIKATSNSQSSSFTKSDTKNGACTNLVHGATRHGNGYSNK